MRTVHSRLCAGWALFEVLITLFITSACLMGSLHLLQRLQTTERAIQLRHEAYAVASDYRTFILTRNQNGLNSLDFYLTFTPDSGLGLVAGKVEREIGLHILKQEYTVTWNAFDQYTNGSTLFTAPQTTGFPHPLLKQTQIWVKWDTEDSKTIMVTSQLALPHPLIDARIEKLLQLNQIKPSL
ncbi:hypothetical protein [Alteromonas sp. C1M14]|uniref:hypothetical protein n=1 Tax=Alteromonas sp. C1M14 TaxID=2841567 RepID=UPI001C084EEE|nr:hypothetical protein [Alteromonas sp. C1M14]MBU2979099.1 hypothetical protein [Alteromonas sp. C1M14]